MASPNYIHSNRKLQQAELRRTWRIVDAEWVRRDRSVATPCFEPRARLSPPEFTPTVFAIMRGEDRAELQKVRNRNKRLRKVRAR